MTNLRRKFKGKLEQKQNVPYTIAGVLGNTSGVVKVPSRNNYVYVRLAGSGVAEVFNNRVQSIYDLPVICGYDPVDPQRFQVLSIQGAVADAVGSSIVYGTGYAPSSRYRWMYPGGGQDPLYLELRQFMPLRISTAGGMFITIYNQIVWDGNEWVAVGGSTLIDLSSYIPSTSGKCLILLLTIDESGDLQYTVGDEVNIEDLSISDIPDIPETAKIVLGGVRLYYGQTAIQEARTNTDIIDLRFPGINGWKIEWDDVINKPVADTAIYDNLAKIELIGSRVEVVNNTVNNGFPGICVLDNGKLLAVYRNASEHQGTKGILKIISSIDDGATWGSDTTLYTDATYDVRDPSITLLSSGRLIVSFFKYNYSGGAKLLHGTYIIYSEDSGDTWSSPVQIVDGFTSWCAVSSRIIELIDGTLLLAVYGKDTGDTYDSSRLVKSEDEGETWSDIGIIAESASRHYNEPNLVLLPNLVLVCMMRSDTPTMAAGKIYKCFSYDDGVTWFIPEVAFDGTGSPRMEVFGNGSVITVYRKNSDDSYKAAYIVSIDGCKNFGDEVLLDNASWYMIYAGMIEYKQGLLGVLYSLEEEINGANSDLLFRTLAITYQTGIFKSSVPTGNAPLQVESSTVVSNLNADMVDGHDSDDFFQGFDLTGLADNDVLVYDSASGKWLPEAPSGGTGGSLTVEEADGTPSVDDVVKIKVTNGSLTDNEDGSVTLDFGSAATDGSAIHDNVADEISAITEKVTLAANDMFIIEDSADSNNKKMVKASAVGSDIFPQDMMVFGQQFKSVAGAGLWVQSVDNAQSYCFISVTSTTHEIGNAVEAAVILKADTYDVYVLGRNDASRGIVAWSCDGVDFITGQDWYASSIARNVQKTGTLVLSDSGRHLIRCRVTGKHASSSSYIMNFTYILFIAQTLAGET